MGRKDNILRDYFSKNEHFADAFNGGLYEGRQILDARRLREVDPVTAEVFMEGEETKATERRRDLIRMAELDGKIFVLFGIENQDTNDRTMPLRIMEYEARTYRKQLKNNKSTKLKPVITLVIYWKPERWRASMSIKEMMDEDTLRYLENIGSDQYVRDYSINLLEIGGMSREELEHFQTDLQGIMGCVKYSKDKDGLRDFIQSKQMKLPKDTVETINIITGANITYKEEEEVVDMCLAIKEIRKEGIEEGRAEGRAGQLEMLASLMVNMGLSYEAACSYCGISKDYMEKYRQDVEALAEKKHTAQELNMAIGGGE